ncbi:NPC intracellular cholesterol transporter 2-like isoform X2 [Ostrea edulis]|uniref:NPC intracellular cholesterol transporter 2-like isoform X2 n=1 Tax=Ostrea edulis TaxID=37623 RepID=UPI0024AFCC6A|nr:NPC intracellular cholesterol transporter 2-like isoform X2 [Ostrea edulis]
MARVIFLVVVLCCATAEVINVEDCGSETGTINQVELTPCPTEPCQVKRGDSATLSVKFTPKVDSTTFTSELQYAIVAGEPLSIPHQNVKMSSSITANNEVVYSNVVSVMQTYPKF